MSSHRLECAHCGRRFGAASDSALTCSVACRNKRYRARLLAQRARLAHEADAALSSGDVVALTRVARMTRDLFAA